MLIVLKVKPAVATVLYERMNKVAKPHLKVNSYRDPFLMNLC